MKKSLIRLYDWSNENAAKFYAISGAILIVCVVLTAFIGFNIAQKFVISEEELECCEKIAQKADLRNIPENITLSKDGNVIKIGIDGRIGGINVKYNGDKVITERQNNTSEYVWVCIIFIVIDIMTFSLCYIAFVLFVCSIAEKNRS